MKTSHGKQGARVALGALTSALALLALAAPASAAPAASKATTNCWLQVINDWLDNNEVDKTYAIPCYTQAIRHLNSYPDVQNYSSAADDIHRAMLVAMRSGGNGGSSSGGGSNGGSSGGGTGGSAGPSSGGSGGGSGSPSTGSTDNGGFFRSIANRVGPSDAQSIPLPLLVLGALAFLLLLAAGGTWLARRLQARRAAPAAAAKRP